MIRREFITLLGGAAACWPLAAWAQRRAVPLVGGLDLASNVHPFLQGLREAGFVEGQNVAIEYRWAEGQYDRLSALVADLVHRQVNVIVAGGAPAALAAKAATTTIPIVFSGGMDPVEVGLVASLNRPEGNLTGVTTLSVDLGPKKLELLHELVPTASAVAVLVNPAFSSAETVSRDAQAAARGLGLEARILHASTEGDLDTIFATLVQSRAPALLITADSFFNSRSAQLAALTLRYAVPAIFQFREFAAAGGLMSYGGSISDASRLTGVYAGRILKGEKPADLPVQQVTKFELVINLKTAKALGLTVPPNLLAIADEVIE
jgi:putative ABC transport system substrate-binding protein